MSGLAFFHPCNALEREIAVPDLAFDLRYLKYAMLAAEHGSFRRAAEALNLSQSTISRRIQLLERRIGIPLFERARSGARPTTAGERFMREAAIGAGQRWRWLSASSAP